MWVQFLVLETSSATSLWFGLETFFGLDSVHAQHVVKTYSKAYTSAGNRVELNSHLVSEYGRRPLRSSTDRTLTVPRTHKRFGDRSFAVSGPRLWNSLPISLWQISSYGQFRRYLKKHLFRI